MIAQAAHDHALRNLCDELTGMETIFLAHGSAVSVQTWVDLNSTRSGVRSLDAARRSARATSHTMPIAAGSFRLIAHTPDGFASIRQICRQELGQVLLTATPDRMTLIDALVVGSAGYPFGSSQRKGGRRFKAGWALVNDSNDTPRCGPALQSGMPFRT